MKKKHFFFPPILDTSKEKYFFLRESHFVNFEA